MGSLATTRKVLAAPVPINGTVAIPYPTGTSQITFLRSHGAQIFIGDLGPFRQDTGDVEVSFNSADIVVTNKTAITWPIYYRLLASFGRSDDRGTYSNLPSPGGGGEGGPVGVADVIGLPEALDDKADVQTVQAALGGKADLVDGKVPAAQLPAGSGGGDVTLPVAMTDVSGLPAALDGKAPTSHTHAISAVTGLQTALDGKAATSHTQAISTITGLQSALDGKAATSHTHTADQISDATAAGRALLTASTATTQRTALGLGTAATASTGTAAGNVVALDGNGRLPAIDGSQLTGVVSSGGGTTLPVGIIAMWSGSSNAVPAGWVLCDGQNGTPDLRNRFLVGAGSNYAVGAIGGSETHTHTVGDTTLTQAQIPNHTHTVSDPGHQHQFQKYANTFAAAAGSGSNVVSAATEGTTGTTVRTTGITVAAIGGGGAHTHTLSLIANVPPYYALCFIMKT